MKYFQILRQCTFVLSSALLVLAVHAEAMFEYDLKTMFLWTDTFFIPEPAQNLMALTGQQAHSTQQIQVKTTLPTDSVFKPALVLCASAQTGLQLDTFANIEKQYLDDNIYYRITPDQTYSGSAFFNVTVLDPEHMLISGSSLDDGVNKIPLTSKPLIAFRQLRSNYYLKVTIPSFFTLTVYPNGYIEKIPLREYGNSFGKMSDTNQSGSSNKKDAKDEAKKTNSPPSGNEQPAKAGGSSNGDNPDDQKDKEKAIKAEQKIDQIISEEVRRLLIQILSSQRAIAALAAELMVQFPQEPIFFEDVVGNIFEDNLVEIEENYSQQSWQDLLAWLSRNQKSISRFVATMYLHPEEFQIFLSLLRLFANNNTLSIEDQSTWNSLSSFEPCDMTRIALTASLSLSSGGQLPLFASEFVQQHGIVLPTGVNGSDHWLSIFNWLAADPQYIMEFVIAGIRQNPKGMETLKSYFTIILSQQCWKILRKK